MKRVSTIAEAIEPYDKVWGVGAIRVRNRPVSV